MTMAGPDARVMSESVSARRSARRRARAAVERFPQGCVSPVELMK